MIRCVAGGSIACPDNPDVVLHVRGDVDGYLLCESAVNRALL